MKTQMPTAIVFLSVLLSACDQSGQSGAPVETQASHAFYQEATWAPDGSTLLLSRYEGERYWIYRIDADGSALERLEVGPGYWTTWSPDGSHFAFHSDRDGNGEIYVAKADGTGASNISNHSANDTTPAWRPDGSKIAFVSDRDGHYQLHLMGRDGSDPIRIGDGPGEEYNPSWSPDGRWLAFFATEENVDWVYVVRPDGSERRRIARGIFPSWSPDGTRILFDHEHTISTVTPQGEDETVVIKDGFAGRWSPDGKRIAFVRGKWPSSEIFLVYADGSGEIKLTP
jgi:Tol biopolymer transport system component